MKKIILLIILILLISLGIYVISNDKYYQKFQKYSCENGYNLYPYGIMDGSAVYFDTNGNEVGVCKSFFPGPTCESAKKKVGKCNAGFEVISNVDYMKTSIEILSIPFKIIKPFCSKLYYGYNDNTTSCPWF